MFDVFMRATITAALLVMPSTGATAQEVARDLSLADVSIGMTYEEANRTLREAGLRWLPSNERHGIYGEDFGNQIAQQHEIAIEAGQKQVRMPYALTLPYTDRQGRYVDITLIGPEGAKTVAAIELRQRYSETFPKLDQVIDALLGKFGFETASCSLEEGPRIAFDVDASTGEVVSMTHVQPQNLCLYNVVFDGAARIDDFRSQIGPDVDLDYGVFFEKERDTDVPADYVSRLKVTLVDYQHMFAEIDRLTNEAIEAQLAGERESTPEEQFWERNPIPVRPILGRLGKARANLSCLSRPISGTTARPPAASPGRARGSGRSPQWSA